MGLPIAYLFILLFIHVPGAIAHIVGSDQLLATEETATGIWFTAIASVCFVLGAWFARSRSVGLIRGNSAAYNEKFALFCLISGLIVVYGLRFAIRTPSIGAVIEKGGGIWVLGVLLGLNAAIKERSPAKTVAWLGAMAIYPVLTLLLGGFLSFGSTPIFIILASLAITTKSHWNVTFATPLLIMFFFLAFISYFQSRDLIRDAVWGGADMETRIQRSFLIITNMELFDPTNKDHLRALDLRLNQNYFVGRAAARLETGEVDWLYGHSLWEGMIAVIPRAIWPSKPVFAGSPKIVMEMTGFIVNDTTTYGVGNVMEFYINFGMYSLVGGFLVLGFLFGWMDRNAARALQSGDLGRTLIFFLPAAAMIHPIGSLVELTGSGACAYLAALGWRWLWRFFSPSLGGATLHRNVQHFR